jgi:hypothetical protein
MRFNRPHRHCEERSDEAIQLSCCGKAGLLRFARKDVADSKPRSRGAICARALQIRCPSPEEEGAGNAGCALHPRSRVPVAQKEAHTSIQGSGEHSDIPCAMALRLISCSPRRRIRFVTVTGGLRSCAPGRARIASAGLAPATGARTTRLHRTLRASFVDRTPEGPLTGFIPPCDSKRA